MDRYHRQTLLPQIGAEGQRKISAARIAFIGCGALGTVSAELLVRAGVGFVRLIDRDLVELTNLQRQTLYDETDVAEQTPKAVAAEKALRRINSSIQIESVVADVHSGNILKLIGDVDLVIDGLDNADTRYLINDAAIKLNKPWIYGAAVGTEGRVMLIVPRQSDCLRCLWPTPPAAGELPTCDTAGVLGTVTATVGALQANEAIRFLTSPSPEARLITLNLWSMQFRSVLSDTTHPTCPACGDGNFEFLNRPVEASLATLCGQDAVQVRPVGDAGVDLAVIAARLQPVGVVQRTPFLVRCDLAEPAGVRLTVFRDGRAIINGVRDVTRARSLYARFVGL